MIDKKFTEQLNKFNILCVDECHLAGADTYNKVITKLDIPIRIFLSGTAMDSESPIKRLNTIGLSGMVIKSILKKDLINMNISRKVKVFINYCQSKTEKNLFDYEDYYREFIMFSLQRASIINKIVLDNLGKKILIAVDEIEHGNFIKEYLTYNKNNFKYKMGDIEFVHGEHSERTDIINDFKDGKIDVLISTRIMQLGLNIQDIAVIIYAVGGKSAISIKQWMGRGERKSTKYDELHFYDFFDDHKYLKNHSNKRIRIYEKENLEVIYNFDKNLIQ